MNWFVDALKNNMVLDSQPGDLLRFEPDRGAAAAAA